MLVMEDSIILNIWCRIRPATFHLIFLISTQVVQFNAKYVKEPVKTRQTHSEMDTLAKSLKLPKITEKLMCTLH